MNKILLIIKKEYLGRVRKKAFAIGTILFPVLYLAMIFGSAYLTEKSGSILKIALVDQSGFLDKGKIERANMADSSNVISLVNIRENSLKSQFKSLGYDGYIIFPAMQNWETGMPPLMVQSDKTLTSMATYPVQNKLNKIWNSFKNEKLGIDEAKRLLLEKNTITLASKNIKDEKANANFASLFGYIAAILIYMILLIYGSQVMMGVMEEKTNRIAEIIVSSVRPFQLMLGKIIGIGLVALTQVLLWIAFIFIIYTITKGTAYSTGGDFFEKISVAFSSVNLPIFIASLLFYLLGGFFFYSSLYAAVGSAVNEDVREAQSLSLPIMMPIIFSIVLITSVVKDPTGPVAFWGSLIPFSSPIVMMARIPFGVPTTVPWWQLFLSMALLIAGFILTTWFAAKIYRTGILMYGKKPTWKEMIKWAIRK